MFNIENNNVVIGDLLDGTEAALAADDKYWQILLYFKHDIYRNADIYLKPHLKEVARQMFDEGRRYEQQLQKAKSEPEQ